MADDLIPPPSPAGRPDKDGPRLVEGTSPAGDDVRLLAVGVDEEVAAAAQEPSEPRPESPYRSRFGLITGALLGMALAAIVIAVVSIFAPRQEEVPWSEWRPASTDAFIAIDEIAQHVGRQYRVNDGTQLVDVESGPIALDDVPLSVVLRSSPVGGDIHRIRGKGVWYVLSGLGVGGSIDKEAPSAERLALLLRESLELSLYTLRYVDSVDHVITLLPPSPPSPPSPPATAAAGATPTATPTPAAGVTATPTAAVGAPAAPAPPTLATSDPTSDQPLRALLFRPGDLRAQLALPLALTLDPETPRPRTIRALDVKLINEFTAENLFNVSLRTNQTGEVLLVLDRTRPASATATPAPTPGK